MKAKHGKTNDFIRCMRLLRSDMLELKHLYFLHSINKFQATYYEVTTVGTSFEHIKTKPFNK